MRETNIASIDLNLVPALEALLRLRNVTHAAADVGLSQPAMSRALARLRDLQRDPLLVRTRSGYILTPRALALQPELTAAVQHLRAVFQQQTFVPGLVRRTLRLAAADIQTIVVLPGILSRLAVEAPGVDLRVEPYSADILTRLDSGALDLAFALSNTPLPPGISSEVVGEDHLALVMRAGHPAADHAWTLADYGRHPHVTVALLGDGQSDIDALLAAAGVARRIALVTPYFMAALAAVAATDMVTTISAALATRFAAPFGLVLREPPFASIRLESTLVCSHVRAADPFLVWFRALVRDVAETVGLTACSPEPGPAGDDRPRTP
ncbi:LysR family transcriptional regulator [Beijerinckia sp. L45]|uniref:LysR family transcriptional regulator n=1 Tax=Beijerinckia sp. L45 TaxID=1641855 RepID=UPI00131D5BA5|nr:LysR family transcriptional regulator [Beijerinckia sp. L45]